MSKTFSTISKIAAIMILMSLILSACVTATPTPAPTQPPVNTKAPVVEPTKAPVVEPTKVPVVESTKAPVVEPTKVSATKPAAAGGFQLAQRIADKVKKGEKLIIRVSYHDVSNEFAPQIKAGVEKAAKELGYDAVMVGPVGAKAEDQIAELESLMEKGVDGIAISSVSTDALAPVINKAQAAGIPVITFNTDNPSSNRLAFVGQDLVGSGRIAGDLIAKQMTSKGQVIITTLDAAAQWSLDREKGAREALSKYPDIKVLATINTGTEPQAIYSAIENAMLANKTTTGILSMECCSVSPAAEYVKRNDLKGKVTVVGFDFLPSTMQLLKDGFIQATIGQGPEKQGYEAVRLVGEAIKGNKVVSIDTGAEVVDATNIGKYLK